MKNGKNDLLITIDESIYNPLNKRAKIGYDGVLISENEYNMKTFKAILLLLNFFYSVCNTDTIKCTWHNNSGKSHIAKCWCFIINFKEMGET